MFLKNLQLKNFRNYNNINLNFNKNTIIIAGDNGQGKTNLLESIYYISSGKPHRTNIQEEIINWESDYAVIRAFFINDDMDSKEDGHLIELELRKDGTFKIKVDGAHYSRKSDFISVLPSVIFSPDDLRIIKSGPSNRRDFLDGILERSDMGREFFVLKTNYQKVLNQRNSLLKSMSGDAGLKNNLTLDTWNESLVNYGHKIIEYRMGLLKDFKKNFADFLNLFFPGLRAEIKYILSWNRKISAKNNFFNLNFKNGNGNYLISEDLMAEEAVFEGDSASFSIRDKFITKLKENLKRELIYKTTIIGPHRDDFKILIDGKDIKSFGSQGQQRIAVICLKFCEINILKEKRKTNPVLLLDDVLSELDNEKKRLLIEIIKNSKFQTFITTANPDIFKDLDVSGTEKFFISHNKIS